jgi:hypothetical protein
MHALLRGRNRSLLRDLEQLTVALASCNPPGELEPYRSRLLTVCGELRRQCQRNITDLDLRQDEILEDVLSNTQQVTQTVKLLSTKMATPVVRSSAQDRISLHTITWLHRSHNVTAALPAAFADGDCAVWPFLDIAPIYFFPAAEQRGLLYQPLYFHEFGHLLYVCHKPEMDDLVRDLQATIEDLLRPAAQRNDQHSAVRASERQAIAYTWYRWAQELFCDAVGLMIGGPCFLLAFSGYLGTMGRGDFYRYPGDLRYSTHPVKWLRMKFLIERAKAEGLSDVAAQIENEWSAVAATMQINEDYHGFYDKSFQPSVTSMLEDMLVEAEPRRCTLEEAKGDDRFQGADSIVCVLNRAWHVHRKDPDRFPAWQAVTLRALFGAYF